jgi:hypothetical protein
MIRNNLSSVDKVSSGGFCVATIKRRKCSTHKCPLLKAVERLCSCFPSEYAIRGESNIIRKEAR